MFMPFSIYHNVIHIMRTQIIDLIIANLLIFSHTFSKGTEHFVGRNRVSSAVHCRIRHLSIALKRTEEEIKVCGIIKSILVIDFFENF